jgi:hypothetical protein
VTDGSEKNSGAEEYVSAEIKVASPIGPNEEKGIRDALAKIEGLEIDSLHIDECKVTVCYDPTRITSDELAKLISQAGASPGEIKTDRAPLL